MSLKRAAVTALLAALSASCGEKKDPESSGPDRTVVEGTCVVADPKAPPDFVTSLGCSADFLALASEPVDATIPGARSGKVLIDLLDDTGEKLYFQNSQLFKIHHDFASTHLSGRGPEGQRLPAVGRLSEFNGNYYNAVEERRFLLASVTYYEEPKVWALEFAPYDKVDVAGIRKVYDKVRAATFFGNALLFHPTSEFVEDTAKALPKEVPVVTTDQIFADTSYQPLNLGTSYGKLRFVTAAKLATEYVSYQDIVVLDSVPNDISVVAGMITEVFQTPLSHVNVLAQNRGTPNMGLRGATTRPELRQLEGQWVKFTVGATAYEVSPATAEQAEQYRKEHAPPKVTVPDLDVTARELRDVKLLVDENGEGSLRDQINRCILSYGTKACNYGVLSNLSGVPVRLGFAIPGYYYDQFMRENGFYEAVDALLAREDFRGSALVRDQELAKLRGEIENAPVNAEFTALLKAKLEQDYPQQTMRFRTSTNAEDLDGFPCAGCYESKTGDPRRGFDDVLDAVRGAWAGVWFFRTFEERAYHEMDHKKVAMSLLVHHNFPDEEANGVASTANPFDPTGTEPAFYFNVQYGGQHEVVHPGPGITSDEVLLFWGDVKTPLYLAHSNLIEEGTHVLNSAQIAELGTALEAIHNHFSYAYGPLAKVSGFYAMDVEFKFDDEGQPDKLPHLFVKQARPYKGRNQ